MSIADLHFLFYSVLCRALSYPALSCSILPYPTLPYSTLPYPHEEHWCLWSNRKPVWLDSGWELCLACIGQQLRFHFATFQFVPYMHSSEISQRLGQSLYKESRCPVSDCLSGISFSLTSHPDWAGLFSVVCLGSRTACSLLEF